MKMSNLKKLLALLLALAMVFALVACGGTTEETKEDDTTGEPEGTGETTETPETPEEPAEPPFVSELVDGQYVRADDEDIYERNLGKYAELAQAAKAAETNDERFVLYAQAEAYLLDSAVMQPNTTQGGAYTISRIAPRTVPYVQWGNDDDRLFGLVIADEFLTPDERADLFELWGKAVAGEGEYDPAAYLTEKGHTLQDSYTLTFQTAPATPSTAHHAP